MSRVPEWVAGAFAVILLVLPWLLTALAWWRWSKSKTRGTIVVFGNVLTALSCLGLLPLAIHVPARWEQLRVNVFSVTFLASSVCAVLGLIVLPFANVRAKWLSFAACLLNVSVLTMFFLSLD